MTVAGSQKETTGKEYMEKIRKAAFEYRDLHGFSVIPVNIKTKKPVVKWGEFQDRKPTDEELNSWFSGERVVGLGIVTGPVSDLFVLDVDPGYDEAKVKDILKGVNTITVTTPRKGAHYYFRYPTRVLFTIGTERSTHIKGLDYRGKGGYVCAPPTPGYRWDQESMDSFLLEDIPNSIYNIINDLGKSNAIYNNIASSNTNKYLLDNNILMGGDNKMTTGVRVNVDDFLGQTPDSVEESAKEPDLGDNKVTTERQQSDHKRQQLTTRLVFEKGSRDDSVFSLAYGLFKAGFSEDDVVKAVLPVANACVPPFPVNEALAKVRSAQQHYLKKSRDITAEIREWLSWNEGEFNTDRLFRELKIEDRHQKKVGAVSLQRMAKAGEIIKGTKAGYYRMKEDELREMDFINADSSGIDLQMPLDVTAWAKIMPKNILMIAGEVNSGKTAFCLNVAHMNKDTYPVRYYSSEMGEAELKERLVKFGEPLESWLNMKFYERESNFADVVDPNGINIIDFLELHDEFYKAGGFIKQIFDKLDKGIALIAIQKNPGRDSGLGGERTKEKARLYLAMEFQKLKIVKAKNWANPRENPNGYEIDFILREGCRFSPQGFWKRPTKGE